MKIVKINTCTEFYNVYKTHTMTKKINIPHMENIISYILNHIKLLKCYFTAIKTTFLLSKYHYHCKINSYFVFWKKNNISGKLHNNTVLTNESK